MSDIATQLSELLSKRAPKLEVLRATLGDGQGNVLYPALSNYVFVRLRGATTSVVPARNLQVPVINNLAVDVERTVAHNKVSYRVLGLTEGVQYPTGEQPVANTVLHAFTHLPTGYDPAGFVVNMKSVKANYSMLASDTYIGVETTAARTITLLDASLVPMGKAVIVHDESGTGAATNNITISGSSFVISTNRGGVLLLSNGRTWVAPLHM